MARRRVTPVALALLCGAMAAALPVPNEALAQSSGLEEIVVTARRREERAQSIPLAITAFSQKEVESKRIMRMADLGNYVPSLSSTTLSSDSNEAYSSVFRIRGLKGAVVYFADVPLGSVDYRAADGITHGTSQGFFFDLDNLEVIKGPQGTLFGKNSIGGLLSIQPKKPTNEYEGYVSATLGNYNNREFEGAVNLPVVKDKVLIRIAGQSQRRDGYTKDLLTGTDYDDRNNFSWRVGVTVRPTENFENYLIYDGYRQNVNGGSKILSYIDPGKVFSQIPLGPVTVPLTLGNGPGLAGLQNPATAGATVVAAIQAGALSFYPELKSVFAQQQAAGIRAVVGRTAKGGKNHFYGFTDQATWNISDDLSLKNIAAVRVFKQLSSGEHDGTYLPIIGQGDPVSPSGWNDHSAQYSEELQLQGTSFKGKLDWVVGGFLQLDKPIGPTTQITTALGGLAYNHFDITNRTKAVFAHGIYDLSDYVPGLRFTAGYRYTWDFVSVQELGTNGPAVIRNAAGAPTNCSVVNFDNNCITASNAKFSAKGWNLSLDYQLNPNTLVYVRSGNAYRPGTTNPQLPLEYQNLKPEHVTDVEIGIKSDWSLGGLQARTNADVFYTHYKDIGTQRTVLINDASGTPHSVSIVQNAASAGLYGAELEATFKLPFGLDITPRGAYIYSKYNKYPESFGPPGQNPPFQHLPKLQYSLTGTYHLPIDSAQGEVAMFATYAWKAHTNVLNGLPNGEIAPIIPSHSQIDLGVEWTNFMGYPLDARFFMTNATNKAFVTGEFPLYAQLGYTSLSYNEPRMFGFTLKYRFE